MVSVTSSTSLYQYWARTAVEAEHDARRSRKDAHPGRIRVWEKTSADSSRNLSREFGASVLAITASAVCIEALAADLRPEIPPSTRPRAAPIESGCCKRKPQPAAQRALDVIFAAVRVESKSRNRWRQEAKWLFALRNSTIHYKREWEEGLALHPRGTLTSPIMCKFTLEDAERALTLTLEIIEEVSKGNTPHDDVAAWIRNIAGFGFEVRQQREIYRRKKIKSVPLKG